MKQTVCQSCRHRLYSLLYTPKFCRNCGGENLEIISFTEWIAALILAILAIYYLTG